MISAELRDGHYLIRFKGKKQQFDQYINNVMRIPDKAWDGRNKCWSIPQHRIEYAQALFGDIEFLEEVKEQPKKVLKADDLADIGSNMKLKPYQYQKEAIKFAMDNHSALIVYPCGSGKTPIGIGLYLEAREHKIIKGPGMVIVKASLKTQWLKEVGKFSDLKATIIQTESEVTETYKIKIKRIKARIGRTKDKDQIEKLKKEIADLQEQAKQAFKEQFKGYDLFIMNYETLRDESVKSELLKKKLEFVFADEVHYIKNRESKRSKALCEFGDVKMKIGATATPVGKNPEDLFGIFKFVAPSVFSSWASFAKLYIKYAGYGRISGFRNLEHLRKKIAPYLIVKSKEEISEQLPKLLVIPRYVDLSDEQFEATKRILAQLDDLHEQEKAIRARMKSEKEAKENRELMKIEATILALQTFAQEIADDPRLLLMSESDFAKEYYVESENPKLELLADMVEEIIDSGEKVCIFSRFEKIQTLLAERIHKIDPNIKIAYVKGSMSDKTRYSEVYDKFRDDDEYKVLIMTDAGAEGLNLSKCKYLIEYDLAESYAKQTQRHGRIERSDSVHDNVFVYQIVANESWDEIQAKIVEKKEGYDAELIKSLARSED